MASDGYGYLVDELHGHMRHVRAVSEDLGSTARQDDDGSPPNAFGLIGAFIPNLLQPLVDRANSLKAASHESVDTSAQNLRHTIDNYDDVEQQAASTFRTGVQ